MVGCSLKDAFPDNTEKAGKVAKKEERKKAAICKGPALSFLKGGDNPPDPDRPAEPIAPPPEKMASNATSASQPVNQYFGKGETDEAFADFSPSVEQNPGYKLQPDFLASFQEAGLGKASGIPAKDNNQWSSLLGTESSESNKHKPWGRATRDESGRDEAGRNEAGRNEAGRNDQELLHRKIDTLFARLESMECQNSEFASTEIALFILSGLFLLFGLETLRKFK
jgi:hypothetical protein